MSENETKFDLPYNVDIELLDKILNDLKNTGKEGVNLETLWIDVGATKNINRSYTLNMAKFLKLVDSNTTKVWLTDFGMKLRYGTKEERNKLLALNMPQKYLSMFKWILDVGELRSSEIKSKYIDAWGSPSSTLIWDRAIAVFLNYCQWLNLVVYSGRGNQSKATITNFGRKVLESPLPDEDEKEDQHKGDNTPPITPPPTTLLPNAVYPIKIITSDRGAFDWGIRSETDWGVIDSIIRSIREGWEKTHKDQPRGEG